MPARRTDTAHVPGTARWRGGWLLLRVHLDGMWLHPRAYAVAAWWRLRGKRVRARAQFARLLAASPRAYHLWQRGETWAGASAGVDATPRIVALVDVHGATPDAIALTERSLAAEGLAAVHVGSPPVVPPDVADPADDADDAASELWFMPLAAGDVLAPGAADTYREAARAAHAHLLYADDDLLDGHGLRHAPHFKPGWNAELWHHFDYLTGACILRAAPEDLAGLEEEDWARGLVAKALSAGGPTPRHIPRMLHHRRTRPSPRVPATLAAPAGVDLPTISVIVPTRNRLDLLRPCLEGLARTDYPGLDVIVVDNGSDDPATLAYLAGLDPALYRVLRHPGPFNFSTLNNRAAAEASGALLCLLNNDIEVIAPDWLRIMAVQALRPEVGAVGARLLYPGGLVQHAGVVVGMGGGAGHAHRLLHPEAEGYFRRHALPQFVSAVTAACLVVRRDRFAAVDGLDEVNFAVAFNDVDLCLRLNRRGWQSFYEPRATLVHHESVSRGLDRDPVGAARLAREIAALQRLWGTVDGVDPFHHPELSRADERFVLRLRG